MIKTIGNNGRTPVSKQISKLFFLIGFSLFIAATASAQTSPPANEGVGDEVDVPFDGGISLLVAAGVAYGVARKKQKPSEAEEADVTEK